MDNREFVKSLPTLPLPEDIVSVYVIDVGEFDAGVTGLLVELTVVETEPRTQTVYDKRSPIVAYEEPLEPRQGRVLISGQTYESWVPIR